MQPHSRARHPAECQQLARHKPCCCCFWAGAAPGLMHQRGQRAILLGLYDGPPKVCHPTHLVQVCKGNHLHVHSMSAWLLNMGNADAPFGLLQLAEAAFSRGVSSPAWKVYIVRAGSKAPGLSTCTGLTSWGRLSELEALLLLCCREGWR